jgi:hypothetical protein
VQSQDDDGADDAAPIARLPNGLVIVKNPQTPEECEAAIDDLRGLMVQLANSELERHSAASAASVHPDDSNNGGSKYIKLNSFIVYLNGIRSLYFNMSQAEQREWPVSCSL